MTISLTASLTASLSASRRIAMLAAVVAAGFAPTGAIGAQGGPPTARAPHDSQPALLVPVSPSRPPSAVAPRARAVRQVAPTTADTGLRLIKRVSAPVDSVRPAPAHVTVLDPRFAPPVQAAPLAPGANAGVQPVAVRASLASDQPPANATARCKDGTYLTTVVDDNTCRDNGGLTVAFPKRQAPPPRPKP